MRELKVDFKQSEGKMKPMHAVNNGPAGSVRGFTNAPLFTEAEIPYARLHDSAFESRYGGDRAVDVHRIFGIFPPMKTTPPLTAFRPRTVILKRSTRRA